jgi:hypothetical protein
METSDRLKTYFGALYLKFYKFPSAVALPFVVVSLLKGGIFSTTSFIILAMLYLAVFVSAAFDDKSTVSRTLVGLQSSRTPTARRNEAIFYAVAFIIYNLVFLLSRDTFQQFGLGLYLLGLALFAVIYLLRPGAFRLK